MSAAGGGVVSVVGVLPRLRAPTTLQPTALQILLDETGTEVNVELYQW